jgi:hypothetical protein
MRTPKVSQIGLLAKVAAGLSLYSPKRSKVQRRKRLVCQHSPRAMQGQKI